MFLTDNIKNKKINLEPCNFEFIMVVINLIINHIILVKF